MLKIFPICFFSIYLLASEHTECAAMIEAYNAPKPQEHKVKDIQRWIENNMLDRPCEARKLERCLIVLTKDFNETIKK